LRWLPVFLSSLAFALYVLCPRMSAMLAEQAKLKGLNIHAVIVLGLLFSIPFFFLLLGILERFGMFWAVLFAAIADFAAAALLGVVELKVGVELAVITIFVYAGIKIAPLVTKLLLG